MLDASFRQLERGTGDIPEGWAENDWDVKYLKIRQAVVHGRPKSAPVTYEAVRAAALEAASAR